VEVLYALGFIVIGGAIVYTSLPVVYLSLLFLTRLTDRVLIPREIARPPQQEEEELVALITAAVYGYIKRRRCQLLSQQMGGRE